MTKPTLASCRRARVGIGTDRHPVVPITPSGPPKVPPPPRQRQALKMNIPGRAASFLRQRSHDSRRLERGEYRQAGHESAVLTRSGDAVTPMHDAKRTDVPIGGNASAQFDPASSCRLLLACVRIVRIVDDATGTYARTHAGATDTGADADTCTARDPSCLVDTDTHADRTMACRYAGIYTAAADPETDTDTWHDRDSDTESGGTATGQKHRQADDCAQTRDGKDIHHGFFLQAISVWPLA